MPLYDGFLFITRHVFQPLKQQESSQQRGMLFDGLSWEGTPCLEGFFHTISLQKISDTEMYTGCND